MLRVEVQSGDIQKVDVVRSKWPIARYVGLAAVITLGTSWGLHGCGAKVDLDDLNGDHKVCNIVTKEAVIGRIGDPNEDGDQQGVLVIPLDNQVSTESNNLGQPAPALVYEVESDGDIGDLVSAFGVTAENIC